MNIPNGIRPAECLPLHQTTDKKAQQPIPGRIWTAWLENSLPHPSPLPQERVRGHVAKCRNLFFRVWSAVERGEDDGLFQRLHRAPSPWGEGRGEGGPPLFNHDEKMRNPSPVASRIFGDHSRLGCCSARPRAEHERPGKHQTASVVVRGWWSARAWTTAPEAGAIPMLTVSFRLKPPWAAPAGPASPSPNARQPGRCGGRRCIR